MRLFCGLQIPEEMKDTIRSCRSAFQARYEGRFVPDSNHHITVAFLGDVPSERVDEVKAILTEIASLHPSPRVTLSHAGFFGRQENAILVLHVVSEPDLVPLHTEICDRMEAASLPAVREPFSPHITIARHAKLISLPEVAFKPSFIYADALTLFLSHRPEGGELTYTPIFQTSFLR